MSETQVSQTQRELTARSAMWLVCPDCRETSRVLAVMASRVLKERRECPQCLSTRAPHLRQTQQGAHIPVPEELHAASNGEEAYLREWIDADDRKARIHSWFRVLLGSVAARFSRSKLITSPMLRHDTADEPGLDLTHLEE
jgi:hypothetical protein